MSVAPLEACQKLLRNLVKCSFRSLFCVSLSKAFLESCQILFWSFVGSFTGFIWRIKDEEKVYVNSALNYAFHICCLVQSCCSIPKVLIIFWLSASLFSSGLQSLRFQKAPYNLESLDEVDDNWLLLICETRYKSLLTYSWSYLSWTHENFAI